MFFVTNMELNPISKVYTLWLRLFINILCTKYNLPPTKYTPEYLLCPPLLYRTNTSGKPRTSSPFLCFMKWYSPQNIGYGKFHVIIILSLRNKTQPICNFLWSKQGDQANQGTLLLHTTFVRVRRNWYRLLLYPIQVF